jgi:Protein of unknown function (DUF4239)
MNLYWVYDIPGWLFAILVISTCIAIGLVGHRLTDRWVRRITGNSGEYNDLVYTALATVGVFFGITLGLISVGTWQNFADVNTNVNQEAATLGVLYRMATVYPESANYSLKFAIEDYTQFVIEEEWPLQRKGIVPEKGSSKIDAIQKNLSNYEPTTESMQAIYAETLAKLDDMIIYRSNRLANVTAGLPDTLWWVVIIGALINLILPWFLVYNRELIQYLMIIMMAATIGILIYLMGAMDNPFRGEFSVSSETFKLVHKMMKS